MAPCHCCIIETLKPCEAAESPSNTRAKPHTSLMVKKPKERSSGRKLGERWTGSRTREISTLNGGIGASLLHLYPDWFPLSSLFYAETSQCPSPPPPLASHFLRTESKRCTHHTKFLINCVVTSCVCLKLHCRTSRALNCSWVNQCGANPPTRGNVLLNACPLISALWERRWRSDTSPTSQEHWGESQCSAAFHGL